MKKVTIFIITFCIALLFINAQSITVTSPSVDENWNSGESIDINWIKVGTMNSEVKIRLFNEAGVRVFAITNNTNNDGNYSWTVPGTISEGNYVVMVKTIDDAVYDQSDLFSINREIVSTGTITVSNPTSATSFYTNQWALLISWGDSGELTDNLRIEVIPEGSPGGTMLVIAETPNIGEYEWRNPGGLTGAGRFFVRVKTLDGAVWGDSDVYEVMEHAAPASTITIVGPDSRSEWNVNSPRMINWRNSGEMDDRVSIKLYNSAGTTLIRTISDNTANDEAEHWVVSADLPAADYLIRITTIDGLITGDSEVFPITRPGDVVDPPPPPRAVNIKIKFPNTTTIWKTGEKVDIVWSKTSIHGRVKIQLFKNRKIFPGIVIAANTANDGKFTWNIPVKLVGGKYVVKITTLDKSATGNSGVFVIKSKMLNLRTTK